MTTFTAALAFLAVGQQPTPIATPADIQLGAELTTVSVTAAEAARISIDKSPKLRLAKALVMGAHGLVIEAQSGLLPSLGLSASGTEARQVRGGSSNGNSTGSAGSSYSAQLSLSQLLFDFGHTVAIAQQSMANERAAKLGMNRAEQDLVFVTKSAYYQFVLDSQLVAVQVAAVKDRKAQQDLAQARVDAGPGEPSDLLAAKTNYADSLQLLVVARSTALTARITLAITMGIDPRTPIAAVDSVEATVPDSFTDSYKLALLTRPDLLQSLQQLRAAGYEVRAATTNDAPSLSLVAGYSGTGQNDPTTNQSSSIGLMFNWALFDGFNTRGKKIAAQADLESARATLTTIQLTIGSDVATAWSTLQFAEQRLPIVIQEQLIATESMRIAEGRYKAGIGTFTAVMDAEATLVTAQQAAASAQTNLSISWAALRHAVGDSK